MICNERDIRNRTVRALAEAVMTAARTAPKAKGRDLVEAALITEDDLERLAEAMREALDALLAQMPCGVERRVGNEIPAARCQ
jgi:uncharacterized ferredoxin-like protein